MSSPVQPAPQPRRRPIASGRHRPRFFRTRIFLGVLAITAISLASVFFLAREVLHDRLNTRANSDVEQELEEFLAFSRYGTDPRTGGDFASSSRLLEVYLAGQIPAPEETLAGFVDDRVIQMRRGEATRRLDPDSPVVQHIADSPHASGIIEATPDGSANHTADLHWGKVHLQSQENDRPASFVVVRYTDADQAELTSTLQLLAVLGAAGLIPAILLGAALAFDLGRTPKPPVGAAGQKNSRRPA